ncbi:HNH endonuclease [Methylovirgula sp. HY1]|uniref:HNH endonuclease n=1 Tax=Methylovirgula sp. HY1 TaxID=2822761 RepID=UPI001C5A8120|nr:HNH endonuclease [Methylovirgula sp. HY1]
MKIASGAIARVPPKAAAPFYQSQDWKKIRERIFARDRFTCVVPTCGRAAVVCEHVTSRRNGGSDDDSNLVSLCRNHDNRFKELPNGNRRNAEEWKKIFATG